MSKIKLPGIFLDNVQTFDDAGLFVVNEVPARDSIEAPRAGNIFFEAISTTGFAFDLFFGTIEVNGTLAWDSGTGFQTGFDGPGSAVVVVDAFHTQFTIDPTTDFSSEQLITVRVQLRDVDAPANVLDFTYTFTIEDVVQPSLLSALAIGPQTVRATFSEGMLAADATGANDALNPANYVFTYLPANSRIAAVSFVPVSIVSVSVGVFDITTDIIPTFFKRYRLTVGTIADDSLAANTIPNGSNAADFDSWSPPEWPLARRRFDLYGDLLSPGDRADDEESGDLERFITMLQDVVDQLLYLIDRFPEIWDVDLAPLAFIEAMLCELGNPFAVNITENRKRKLVDLLVAIYRQIGTEEVVRNLIRFFMGIEVTNIVILNEETWHLGDPDFELGVNTDLGAGDGADIYTFLVEVGRTLTAEERVIMRTLIDRIKPGHTHFRIIEPADPEFVDHWQLGISELGESTLLH